MRSAKLTGLAVVVGLLAISTFGIHSSGAQGSADLSAQEVLARLAMTYAHCTSYQDAGVVRIVYL